MQRYLRQDLCPNLKEARVAFENTKVVVIGLGGTGSLLVRALVGAGVSNLKIYDNDRISESNLSRQLFYKESDLGKLKTEVTYKSLLALNKDISLDACAIAIDASLDKEQIATIFKDCNLVIDCTDTKEAHLFISKIALEYKVPYLFVSANNYVGFLALFDYADLNFVKDYGSLDDFKDSFTSDNTQDLGAFGPCVNAMSANAAMVALNFLATKYQNKAFKESDLGYMYLYDFSKLQIKRFNLVKSV